MTINELTIWDQLIVRILHMPDEQIVQLAKLIEGITAAELNGRNQLDQAAIEASLDATGLPGS